MSFKISARDVQPTPFGDPTSRVEPSSPPLLDPPQTLTRGGGETPEKQGALPLSPALRHFFRIG